MSSSPSYLDAIVLPLITGESVLDVGCGYGRWGHLIRCNYWEAGLARPPAVDGIDAFAPNVEQCRRLGCYRNVWQTVLPAPDVTGEWDTVLVSEVIEHLPPDAVEETVSALEMLARRRIIFTTPNAPDFRDGHETLVGYNAYEAHRSYVHLRFFRARGYRVRGAGFGNDASVGARLFHRLRLPGGSVLSGLAYIAPRFATHIVAYRDVRAGTAASASGTAAGRPNAAGGAVKSGAAGVFGAPMTRANSRS